MIPDCKICGKCCKKVGWPPFKSQKEIDELPKHLRKGLRHGDTSLCGKDCLWFKNGLCINYAYRPKVCRDFKRGGAHCLGVLGDNKSGRF